MIYFWLYLTGMLGLWVVTFLIHLARAIDRVEHLSEPISRKTVEKSWFCVNPALRDPEGDSWAFFAGIGWPLVTLFYGVVGLWWLLIKITALSRRTPGQVTCKTQCKHWKSYRTEPDLSKVNPAIRPPKTDPPEDMTVGLLQILRATERMTPVQRYGLLKTIKDQGIEQTEGPKVKP